jgi:hypothetical protein
MLQFSWDKGRRCWTGRAVCVEVGGTIVGKTWHCGVFTCERLRVRYQVLERLRGFGQVWLVERSRFGGSECSRTSAGEL